jgi:hypothetical protein
MNWQPIETAPKDGRDVLIGGDYSYLNGVLMASWGTGSGQIPGWTDMEGDTYSPTHWMPLPLPPRDSA